VQNQQIVAEPEPTAAPPAHASSSSDPAGHTTTTTTALPATRPAAPVAPGGGSSYSNGSHKASAHRVSKDRHSYLTAFRSWYLDLVLVGACGAAARGRVCKWMRGRAQHRDSTHERAWMRTRLRRRGILQTEHTREIAVREREYKDRGWLWDIPGCSISRSSSSSLHLSSHHTFFFRTRPIADPRRGARLRVSHCVSQVCACVEHVVC